ncbi:MAG: hypothetical protein J1E01_09650 [Acetatifactor sp.]|nr:hypothetical protein [Acetatifactor sp.]
MAREWEAEAERERSRIQQEKQQLKKDQKNQRREVKRRAKEIARQEEALGDEGGSGLVTFGATVFIVVLWLAVIAVVIKLDVGGFGSSVMTPILQNVPVLNKILPGNSLTETNDPDSYGGYSSLPEAVAYIRDLELEVERLQTSNNVKDADLETLRAEVRRLQEFESAQVEFQRIQKEFFEEVVYSDKGPGAEEYKKWYEAMNPATAESLYKQVIIQLEESSAFQEFARSFAQMKPKAAAQLLEEMTDLNRVARILMALNAEERAAIMNQMSAEFGAKVATIMDPNS